MIDYEHSLVAGVFRDEPSSFDNLLFALVTDRSPMRKMSTINYLCTYSTDFTRNLMTGLKLSHLGLSTDAMAQSLLNYTAKNLGARIFVDKFVELAQPKRSGTPSIPGVNTNPALRRVLSTRRCPYVSPAGAGEN